MMIELLTAIVINCMSIIAFFWTAYQEYRHRKNKTPIFTDEKLEKFNYLLEKFIIDIKACINEKPSISTSS